MFVPVADQDRSLEFYVGVLGCEQTTDFAYAGDARWIEVRPPGATNALALCSIGEGVPEVAARTLCAISVADIDSIHGRLHDAGIDIDPVVGREGTSRPGLLSEDVTLADPVPPQVCFRDPDGNRFLLVGRA